MSIDFNTFDAQASLDFIYGCPIVKRKQKLYYIHKMTAVSVYRIMNIIATTAYVHKEYQYFNIE